MSKYKSGDVVITTANHIIEIIDIDPKWNEKTNNNSTYYTYKIIKQSNAYYVGERISDDNIVKRLFDEDTISS